MTDYAAAWSEIARAIRHNDLWLTLGSWDIKRMYRRSVLGPLWLTISTAAFIAGIGVLYGALLKQPLDQYLPYLAIGYVVWMFASGSILAGTSALVQEGAILKQVAIGSPAVILRVIWRQILIAIHQLAVPLIVMLFYHKWPEAGALWVIPGLVLLVVNVGWTTAFIAIASARYRDVPPIVASILQIVFFLTPVIWGRQALGDYAWLVDVNPFTHLIDIVRSPLIGEGFPATSFQYSAAMAAVGCALTFLLFARTRDRLVYWL